jgi:hypothetical protein
VSVEKSAHAVVMGVSRCVLRLGELESVNFNRSVRSVLSCPVWKEWIRFG